METDRGSRDTGAVVRRAGSVVVLLGLVGICLWSAFDPSVRVCGDSLAATGGAGVVTICRPLSLTDPAVLTGALLTLLLLLPDLQSLKIAGLVELQRTAEQTREQVDEVRAQLVALTSVSAATAANSAEQTVVLAPEAADSAERLESKGAAFSATSGSREARRGDFRQHLRQAAPQS